MTKNRTWAALLAAAFLIVATYTGMTAHQVLAYASLAERTPALKVAWQVKTRSADRFVLEADFVYTVAGREFSGRTPFTARFYRSPEAADAAVAENRTKVWLVWYDPADPQHASLTRVFPYKSLFYSVILWGLLIYFTGLGYYVKKMHTKSPSERNSS